MKTAENAIENLFREKVLLYQDLVSCLEKEKICIMETDVDALWRISDDKHLIATKIEDIRGRILDAVSNAGIDHDMNAATFNPSQVASILSGETAIQVTKANTTLLGLKNTAQNLVKTNRLFVEEYLNVLDDLIGIISNAKGSAAVYDSGCGYEDQSTGNLLLHKEV